jgi:hypothetical protein
MAIMGAGQNYEFALAGAFCERNALGLQWGTTFPTWFQAIPPERVGLNGEYDYYGLQKRVEALFHKHFVAAELAQLKVRQRGRVVVLQGHVKDHGMLQRLVELASQVEGAIRVESLWVTCDTEPHDLIAV